MVRKQLYITEDQDRRLKRRAAELGTSEAELVRRALDVALEERDIERPSEAHRRAVDVLIAGIRETSKKVSFPEGWRFRRDDAYADREARIR